MKPRVRRLPELDPVWQPDRTDLIAFVSSLVAIAGLVAAKVWL